MTDPERDAAGAFEAARGIIAGAVRAGAFPCAVAEVGDAGAAIWIEAFGTLTGEPDGDAAGPGTLFDLASLTKVLATATAAMRLLESGRLGLDDPVASWSSTWRGADRETVTVRDLLAHSSGLPAYLRLFESCRGRVEFEEAIGRSPLEYEPGSRSLYSDLGFILLGFVLETAGGRTLADQFAELAPPLTGSPLLFRPPRALRTRTAPTGVDPWRGRLLRGEVHDPNCWALGGCAGHAGLFGTASAVGDVARLVLRAARGADTPLARPETVRLFGTRAGVPGSARALAWDTMRPAASCGTRMSSSAIGHTGFTGTSLWIDIERGFYAVLLTNRVHPAGGNDAILTIRPAWHDTLVAAWDDGALARRFRP